MEKRRICKLFLQGTCNHGNNCWFSHNLSDQPTSSTSTSSSSSLRESPSFSSSSSSSSASKPLHHQHHNPRSTRGSRFHSNPRGRTHHHSHSQSNSASHPNQSSTTPQGSNNDGEKVLLCQLEGDTSCIKVRVSSLDYHTVYQAIRSKFNLSTGTNQEYTLNHLEGNAFVQIVDEQDLRECLENPGARIHVKPKPDGQINANSQRSPQTPDSQKFYRGKFQNNQRKLDSFIGKPKDQQNWLLGMSQKDPRMVLLEPDIKKKLRDILSQEVVQQDVIQLILRIFTTKDILNTMLDDGFFSILDIFLASNFFTHIQNYQAFIKNKVKQFRAATMDREKQSVGEELNSNAHFILKLLARNPHSAGKFPLDVFEEIHELLKTSEENNDGVVLLFETIIRGKAGPPDGLTYQTSLEYKNMEIFPTQEEILKNERVKLNKNLQKGAYSDPVSYLHTQYHLLREDCMRPLREGIQKLIIGKYKSERDLELRIYEGVKIIALITTVPQKSSFRLQIRDKQKIQRHNRLMFGSLVCLSSNNFQTLYFATVSNTDAKLTEKGRVDISFILDPPDLQATYVMVESSNVYFDPYYQVLKAIQEIDHENIPFENFFVRGESKTLPPKYLNPDTKFDISPVFTSKVQNVKKFPILGDWSGLESTMDESQLGALKRILTNELALIQGPPGTGKTYIGLAATKILLKNKESISLDAPIVVVTYTNHALDQFLEGILDFIKAGELGERVPDPMVRVGSRSKSEKLEPFNIRKLRQESSTNYGRDVWKQLRGVEEEIKTLQEKLTFKEIFPFELRVVLRPEQWESFYKVVKQSNVKPDQKPSFEDQKLVYQRWHGVSNSEKIVDKDGFEKVQRKRKGKKAAANDQESPLSEDELNEPFSVENLAQRRLKDLTLDDENEADLENESGKDDFESEGSSPKEDDQESESENESEEKKDEGGEEEFENDYSQNEERKLDEDEAEKTTEINLKEVHLKEIKVDAELCRKWNLDNIWNIPQQYRQSVAEYWRQDFLNKKKGKLQELVQRYDDLVRQKAQISAEEDRQIMKKVKIVGMTTTAVARYHKVIAHLEPKIVFVEEAAEVLESHILASLSKSTEHLVLIGDHKQLRPSTAVYELATKYHLNLSLFERLINNGLDRSVLRVQRRMRPEISRLIKPIYPELLDHEKVTMFPIIKGIGSNLFFIDHNQLEDKKHSGFIETSKTNKHEVDFIIKLIIYLMKQGYKSSQITVLTFYLGQQFGLSKAFKSESLENVRISTVDNFQGEENDIIILSTVRCNKEGNMGYCAVDNRICVALSRSRQGLYVLGSIETIKKSMILSKGTLWESILKEFGPDKIGKALSLKCQNHPENVTLVSKAADFDKVREGGCHLRCQERLVCGHACPRDCHPDGHDFPCTKICNKILACGHKCQLLCSKECGPCKILVEKKVPGCGHIQKVPCYKRPDEIFCQTICNKQLPCGHICGKPCGLSPCPACNHPVERLLPCGHTTKVPCFMKIEDIVCKEPCKVTLDCGHPCRGNCGECSVVHKSCDKVCKRILVCSHECKDQCVKECPPCSGECTNFCTHSKCPKKCGEVCAPCREPCKWRCEHIQCEKECHELCERPRCNEPCTRKLKCKHPCLGMCGEKCPNLCRICDPKNEAFDIFFGSEEEPDARFIQLECKHIFEVTGFDHYIDQEKDPSEKISIQFKACPKCKRPIRKLLRYANIIKSCLADINQVKLQIKEQQKQIEVDVVANQRKVLEKLKFASFATSKELQDHLNKLKMETDAQSLKLSRVSLLAEKASVASILMLILSRAMGLDEDKRPACDELLNELKKFFLYSQRDYGQKFGEWFDAMKAKKKEIVGDGGLGISESEKIEIVKAMGFSQGHWFKCKNGHIFAIGECGGAMEESKCNECGAQIGGSSHRLLADNSIAQEMDGSRHSAYTLAQDPNNFDPAEWQ